MPVAEVAIPASAMPTKFVCGEVGYICSVLQNTAISIVIYQTTHSRRTHKCPSHFSGTYMGNVIAIAGSIVAVQPSGSIKPDIPVPVTVPLM